MNITASDIIDVIKKSKIEINEGEDIRKTFADLGIDSLDRTTIYLNVEESLNVTLPEDEEEKFDSIEKMLKFING